MSYHWAYACAYAALRDSHVCLRGTLGARRAYADLTRRLFGTKCSWHHNASLRAAYFAQWTFTTPNLRIWMLKKHLKMRTKKKARRQKHPSSSSSSSTSSTSSSSSRLTADRPAADLQQQQQTSSSRPAAADLQQQEVEKWKWKWKGDARKPHCI